MGNTKDDMFYLEKILTDLLFIQKHTSNIESVELGLNELLLDSMMFRLIQISENAKKLSDNFKDLYPNIPWKAMYGFRNRIVHDYGHVDLGLVYSTIKNDVPELIEILTKQNQQSDHSEEQ